VSEPFGAALRRLRERAGLTQEQLAERAGLSVKAVSALERGERRHPYPHTVGALVAALELKPEERAVLEAGVPRRGQRREPPATPSPLVGREEGTRAVADLPVQAALPVPRQLPAAPQGFIGRVADLAQLDALLSPADSREDDKASDTGPAGVGRAVVISAIAGTAGVGKTALAVVWAHRVRGFFPDGQLYVNLRGYDPGPPAKPGEVLDGFLRALDVPAGKVPPTVEERAALFRSLVDGRRVLVVLDNANSAEQVRPLLPGSSSCLVVVTSRARLTGLAVSVGAVQVNLDLLPFADAVALLRSITGPQRADAEPEAVEELVRLCVRLPLALQLTGQRAAARPHAPLADLVAELADEAQRLEVLSAGTDEFTAVRPVFSWSYRNLPSGQARMFRLLGLHPGPDISTHAATALVAATPAEARCLLDGLAEAHLVEHAGRDRFLLHDLLRAYAREHAESGHTLEDRREAMGRLVGFYLHTAAAADRLLSPGRRRTLVDGAPSPGHPIAFTGYDQALEWCEIERANLVAVTRSAAETGLHAAWQLPNNLWSFFYLRKHWADWITTHQIGLDATRHLGDPPGQARMLNGLGTAYRGLYRFDESVDHFRQALDLCREAGDRWGEGSCLSNLGDAYLGLRRYDEAIDHSRQALDIFCEVGNQYLIGVAMGNVGEAYLGLHQYDHALDQFRQVLDLCRDIDYRYGEGLTLIHLGEAYLGLRRYDEAVDHLTQALVLCREIGNQHGEGLALNNLGCAHHATGRLDTARQYWRAALVIFDNLGDPQADEVSAQLRTNDPDTNDPDTNDPDTICPGHASPPGHLPST
jgi:tetratricopeptide (TPR) repeat protein/transcriptional regulator with XRE-family HTH domain